MKFNKVLFLLFMVIFFKNANANLRDFKNFVSIKLKNGEIIDSSTEDFQINTGKVILFNEIEIDSSEIEAIKFFNKNGSLKSIKFLPANYSGGDSSSG